MLTRARRPRGPARRSEGKLHSPFVENFFLPAPAFSGAALLAVMGKPAAAQLAGSRAPSGDANCVGANEIFRAPRFSCVGAAPRLPGERVWCRSSHPSSLPHALPRRVRRSAPAGQAGTQPVRQFPLRSKALEFQGVRVQVAGASRLGWADFGWRPNVAPWRATRPCGRCEP